MLQVHRPWTTNGLPKYLRGLANVNHCSFGRPLYILLTDSDQFNLDASKTCIVAVWAEYGTFERWNPRPSGDISSPLYGDFEQVGSVKRDFCSDMSNIYISRA